MTTTSVDQLSLEELSAALAAYAGPPHVRTRTRRARAGWMSRRLVLALALVAVLIAGCSYAAHVNPFRWISAASHPATARDKLPAWLASSIADWNKKYKSPRMQTVASTGRFVHELPNGARFYTIATVSGGLCIAALRLPTNETVPGGISFGKASSFECDYSLSPSRPITAAGWQDAYSRHGKQLLATPVSYGLAVDGVTAISFGERHSSVTVPVTDNVWVHRGRVDERRVVLHWADGRTQGVCWAPIADTWTTHRRACPVPY